MALKPLGGEMSRREMVELALNNALPNVDDLPARSEYDITQSQLDTELSNIAATESDIRPVVRGQPSAVSMSESVAAMDAVAASQTAMDAVAASSTAMDAVAASQIAIDAVSASQTARDTINNSSNPITQVSVTDLFNASGTGFDDDPYTGTSQNDGQDDTTAFIEIDIFNEGTIDWDITVSSEPDFDKARVKKNGSTLVEISGTTSSASTEPVSSGDTIRVEYEKDGSNSENDDQVTINSLYWTVN